MQMTGNQEIIKNSENSKVWLWIFIAVPSLFVIAGIITLAATFSSNSLFSESSSDSSAVTYAKNFNFRADIHVDISVVKVVLSADVSPGPENLYMDLRSKADSNIFYQVRLFNSGNNIYRGTLPEVAYGEWRVSLYPENKKPAWRINDESIFPNNIVSIAAK